MAIPHDDSPWGRWAHSASATLKRRKAQFPGRPVSRGKPSGRGTLNGPGIWAQNLTPKWDHRQLVVPFMASNSLPRFRADLTSPKPRAWIQRLSRSRDREKPPLLSEISWHHLGMGDGLTCSGIAHMDKKYTWPAKVAQWQAIAKLPPSDLSDSAQ